MLSDGIRARLEEAAKAQASYAPNGQVGKELRAKRLVMLVGPAATGKSYLMNRIVEHDSDFARVSVFTTREARDDDEPGMFRCLPHDDKNVAELLETIKLGNAVQYVIHPTGRVYGSMPADYPKPYNMLATLSGVVDHLRELPFTKTYTVGLACDPTVWLERFYKRYPGASEERTKRLNEAVTSLEWLLKPENQAHIIWVDTTAMGAEEAIQSVINAVKYNTHDNSAAKKVAERMLERVKGEL